VKVKRSDGQRKRHLPCRAHVLLTMFMALVMTISIFVTWNFHHHQPHQPSVGDTSITTRSIHSRAREQHQQPRTDYTDNHYQKAANQNTISSTQDKRDDSVTFHFIVSSECSSYQLWETLAQFHAAEAVGQCGRFTWIVSGCLPNDQLSLGIGKGGANSDVLTFNVMQQHVDRHFPPFKNTASDCSRLRPELHFTPDYSNMSVYGGPYADGKTTRYFRNKKKGKEVRSSYGNTYVFNNKPNGLLHWAEAHEHDIDTHPDEAIVLIDPDFLFLTRFHLARPDLSVVGRNPQQQLRDRDLVYPGQPAAASYGLGAQWLEFNLVKICGADSPCTNTTKDQVHKHYSAGPPYVIHRADVLALAKKWASLVPPTYDEYPLLYAEMYAYSMAAAHLQLSHNLVNNLFTGCMVGWPNPDRWGRDKEDVRAAEKAAVKESARVYRIQLAAELKEAAEQNDTTSINAVQQRRPRQKEEEEPPASCFLDPLLPPPFLHYCNRYFIKATDDMKQVVKDATVTYRFFAKRRVPHATVLACDDEDAKDNTKAATPTHSNSSHRFLPFPSTKESEQMANGNVDWNSLAVCAISRALNFARNRGCRRRQPCVKKVHNIGLQLSHVL
jgi:hypothetical protein